MLLHGEDATPREAALRGQVQYAAFSTRYPLLVLRSGLVPLASFGSNAAWVILLIGFAMASTKLVLVGIIAFSLTVVFQLVNIQLVRAKALQTSPYNPRVLALRTVNPRGQILAADGTVLAKSVPRPPTVSRCSWVFNGVRSREWSFGTANRRQ